MNTSFSCLFFFFLLLVVNTSSAQSTTISGTVSLPSGAVAGPSGVEIKLSGVFIETGNSDSQQTVTISPGQSSTNYSLSFSEDLLVFLQFDCADCFDLGITTNGAWNETVGVVSLPTGTLYSGTNNNVNITLETATNFSGRVLFPSNFIASGNETITILVNTSSGPLAIFFSDSGVIDAGDSSFDFGIGVPSRLSPSGWFISAACPFDCDENLVFSDQFFATTISGEPTMPDINQAFTFPQNGSFTDLSLTLQGPIIETDPPPDENEFVAPPILDLLLNE